MDILTRENTLVRVDMKNERAEVQRSNVAYYAENENCRAISTGEYLEVQTKERTTRVHLFRKVAKVLVVEANVYLVGEAWIERLDRGVLKKEREFRERIVDAEVVDGFLLVLQATTLTVLDKALKKVERTKLPMKYPAQLSVHRGAEPVIGVLSITEKKAYLFSLSGQLIKTISTSERPSHLLLFADGATRYAAVAHKQTLLLAALEPADSGATRAVATEHLSDIALAQFSASERAVYTFAKEGTVCVVPLAGGGGEVVYVDPAGIVSAYVR